MADASVAVERGGLARGAIGLREVLFQAVTSMAPAGAVALSISLGATWFTALGIGKSVLSFVSPLSYPISETGLVIGIWFAIGVVVLIYLYVRHPARLPKMQQVFSDDVAPETAGSMAGQEGA
jgi:hypothetical protein